MKKLYLEVFSDIREDGTFIVPLETAISIFVYKFCDIPLNLPPVLLTFVITSENTTRAALRVKVPEAFYDIIEETKVEKVVTLCTFPVILKCDGLTVVAGLCAVLRQVVKAVDVRHPLLGFKQSCLSACAETSIWTKFCEVDILETVNLLYLKENWKSDEVLVPKDLARFEVHMSQPVRIHNIQKQKQDLARARGELRKSKLPDSRLDLLRDLDHTYAEGPEMTLADVMLHPSIHIILERIGSVFLKEHLPRTYTWYENMSKLTNGIEALNIFVDIKKNFETEIYINYIFPEVEQRSLYKAEVKKTRPNRHAFTNQAVIEQCLDTADEMGITFEAERTTFGKEIYFDWTTVPFDFQLDDSQVPSKRVERKGQQLDNMTRAVLKIAKNGDQIVDFCSGSGHLGLILAHVLPRCRIILLENKEESINRARKRAVHLRLLNVVFCQSNVDYFQGSFNIGVSLHACGVATDLVIERCIQQRASFVSCPCCYGSIQPNHIISYPRSEAFRNSRLTLKEYFILAHCSDQTHFEEVMLTKAKQGNRCMDIIDSDRLLRAKETDYFVVLCKLDPPSCTPKNNLLVGIPFAEDDI